MFWRFGAFGAEMYLFSGVVAFRHGIPPWHWNWPSKLDLTCDCPFRFARMRLKSGISAMQSFARQLLFVFGIGLHDLCDCLAMERLQTLVIDGDADTYASSIAYRDTPENRSPLYWSLDSQFTWLHSRGLKYKRKDWLTKFKEYVFDDMGACGYRMNDPPNTPGQLRSGILPIATTRALLTSIWMTFGKTQCLYLETACLRSLKRIASIICTHLTDALSAIRVDTCQPSLSMSVNSHERVSGLANVILSTGHGTSMNNICNMWDSMHSAELLIGRCLDDSHAISDVIFFVAFVQKWRGRCLKPRLGAPVEKWLCHLRRGIVQWLARGLEHYTIHEYPRHHDVSKPPPSRITGRGVRVHPDAVWQMLQQSTETSASLSGVVQVRSADCHAGAAKNVAGRWERLLTSMYHHRTSVVWRHVDHLCITADSSTHVYEDALLAIAYSHELGQACYPPLQFIVAGMLVSIMGAFIQFLLAFGIGLRKRT
jgi:hypothetical protein